MKTLKSTKLTALLISAVLIIAAIAGITASAEEGEPSLEIFSKNLSYGGTISIAFAVDAENIKAEDVELLIYTSEPTEDSKASHTVKTSETATVHEREALVFLTPGIASKDMTKQIYVRAHAVVDGVDVYSELERYSVAEYAYDMQYRSKINENFIKLGAALLEVGEQIQTLLPHNVDNSPLDFYYGAAEGGTVDGKYTSGLFKAGETVTLNYTGEIPAGKIAVWNSEAGTIANGATVKASAHAVYTIEFKNGYVPGAYYNDESKVGTRYGTTKTVTGSGSLLGIENNAISTFEEGTTYIVETDFTYNGGAYKSKSPAFFGLQATGSIDNKNMFLGTYIYQMDENASTVTLFGYEFLKGVTYNIRMEYTVGDGNYITGTADEAYASHTNYLKANFKFFVNGTEVTIGDDTSFMIGENLRNNTGADASFWGLGVKVRNSSYASEDFSVSFENTFIAPKVEIEQDESFKGYFANTDIAGIRLDFSSEDQMNSVKTSTHSGSAKGSATITDGALNVSGNPTWFALAFVTGDTKEYAAGTKYVFEADITYNGGKALKSSDPNAAFTGFYTNNPTDHKNGNMFGYNYLIYEDSSSVIDFFGANIEKGTKHKVTIVYTVGVKKAVEVYVDCVKVSDGQLTTNNLSDNVFYGYGFYFRGNSYTENLDVTFDNVFLGVIEAE